MADRVEILFRSRAPALLPRGATVVAAVSGGGDSVALFHLLLNVAPSLELKLVVAHLDHALRPGSAKDRAFVESLARRHGVPVIAARRPVPRLRRRDESPEEAARRVRRAFLVEAARRARAQVVALGHTLDDQAETVLFRLLRGAGPTALAGMRPDGPRPFVRPMLHLERRELRGYLERHGHRFLEDPSNQDLRFDRNRLRVRVMPFLEDQVNARAARHLVVAAEVLREDARCLDRLAEALLKRNARRRGGAVRLPASDLAALDSALGRRVIRGALLRAGVDPRRIHRRHLDAVLALASPGRAQGESSLPGGFRARRTRTGVRIEKSPGAAGKR